MELNLLDRIGDWNPQLFREIKGRLKARNVLITVAISLLGQLLLFMSWLGQLPNEYYSVQGKYCTLRGVYELSQKEFYQLQAQYGQLQTQFAHYTRPQHYDAQKVQELKAAIETVKSKIDDLQPRVFGNCPLDALDLQLWWHDHYPIIFTSLGLVVMFALLVVGSYMLINDLAREENRGTLNFIRLSPQSTQNILIGKLLGVPILLYLAAVLTIPFQLGLALNAQIPVGEILSFWTVAIFSCAFFYTAALLFGLTSSWLGGFQAWLAGGAVLLFLTIVNYRRIDHTPADWLNLFSPSVILPYLIDRSGTTYLDSFPFSQGSLQSWEWFHLPIGTQGISILLFTLLNYGLWTYWIWQALNRRFRNPNTTMLSKRQSYLLVACFSVVTLGFAIQYLPAGYIYPLPATGDQLFRNLNLLLGLNLMLFVCLIAALSPHRQTLQDWARYKGLGTGNNASQQPVSKFQSLFKASRLRDLLWGEKSPTLLAIALNLVISALPVAGWILFWSEGTEHKIKALASLVLTLNIILIYAAITQLMLLMKTPKRTIWATGTLLAVTVLPPFILSLLSINPGQNGGGFWLFTATPWYAIEFASTTLIFQALLVQWSMQIVLSWQLMRQLRKAGESATKALLAEGARG